MQGLILNSHISLSHHKNARGLGFRLLPLVVALFAFTPKAQGDLLPGATLPNPELTSPTGVKSQLYGMLDSVTVLHLWKCD